MNLLVRLIELFKIVVINSSYQWERKGEVPTNWQVIMKIYQSILPVH